MEICIDSKTGDFCPPKNSNENKNSNESTVYLFIFYSFGIDWTVMCWPLLCHILWGSVLGELLRDEGKKQEAQHLLLVAAEAHKVPVQGRKRQQFLSRFLK